MSLRFTLPFWVSVGLLGAPNLVLSGVLGVSIQDMTPELAEALGVPAQGVIVRQISPGGPAEAAGVHVGDVIVEVNRTGVKSKDEFVAFMKKTPAGTSVALTVWRQGEGRYFLGARLAKEGKVASPQTDNMPRAPGSKEGGEAGPHPEGVPPVQASPNPDEPSGPEPPELPRVEGNLVRDGGFEDGLVPPWGSGDLSDGHPWRLLEGARAYGEAVVSPVHSGKLALSIRHATEEHQGWMGVTSQSLRSLETDREYVLEVWARADNLQDGGIRVRIVRHGSRPGVAKGLSGAADATGLDEVPLAEIALPAGTYDWRRFSTTFAAPAVKLDLEILSVALGMAYLDDVSVHPAD